MPGLQSRRISIQTPAVTGQTLLFRLFDNALPIGYARLGILPVKARVSPSVSVRVKTASPTGSGTSTYELKMIEVAQNYRHAGLGTALLQEVIRYCRENHIGALRGEIKGDLRTLSAFYRRNGFTIDQDHRISLVATAA